MFIVQVNVYTAIFYRSEICSFSCHISNTYVINIIHQYSDMSFFYKVFSQYPFPLNSSYIIIYINY